MNHCQGAAAGKGRNTCGLGKMPFYFETAGAKLYRYLNTIYGQDILMTVS